VTPSSFLYQHSEDPENSPEAQTLQRYKDMLENIRYLLLYEVDLRTIKKSDIDMCERDLREIIKGIEKLRRVPHIDSLLKSVDGIQGKIFDAINSLYLASDVIEHRYTARGRELLYQKLRECPLFLLEAIEQFLI